MRKQKIKIATIDLYNNERNEGMRCIGEIVEETKKKFNDLDISYNVYETRFRDDIPDMDSDIFISSGGPGSPFDGEGKKWEKQYFNLIENIYSHNQSNTDRKKYIFFICHSFQMMARFFEFGEVSKRNSKSIGVLPFEKTEAGKTDSILEHLPNPFYAADIREYQVTNPSKKVIDNIGAKILSYEILDVNAEGEPAIAAVKISNEIFGTQFHPEADPESMLYHFNRPDEKKQIVDSYGEEKYNRMLEILQEPNAVKLTRKTVIPNFLNGAIDELNKVLI
jgi:GMP synthase-like glutamine amidotransferase